MLVPPKPSGNIHIAAFYVYKDEARDERMKIAAFIDAGEKFLHIGPRIPKRKRKRHIYLSQPRKTSRISHMKGKRISSSQFSDTKIGNSQR